MGHEELIAYLRTEADSRANKIWDEARAEAEKIRDETSGIILHMQQEHRKRLGEAVREIRVSADFDTLKRTRNVKLTSELRFTNRLFSLAALYLPILRKSGYEEIFKALARELPSFQWKEVRVNPEDTELARSHFPDTEITADNSISGGLEVLSEDRKICVTNTFEKRLQRAWHFMLPILMKDIYQEFMRERTAPEI